MELSDYINLTLTEIAEGVRKATKDYKGKGDGCVLSETQMKIDGIPFVRLYGTNGGDTYKPIIKVAFRVGVEVEESEESNNKIGGSLKVVSADVGALTKGAEKSVHEVSFELPLILPQKRK